MAKLTLSDLASLANQASAIATINANNALIETALENTLSRDGTSPNTMGANLDMNSNRILNLPAASADTEPVRKVEFDVLQDSIDELDASTDAAAASAAEAAASATSAAASAAKLQGTSTTSVLIGTGSKAFTTQADKFFDVGTWLLIVSEADETNYMHGNVTAYSGTSLTVNVTNTGGAGTFDDWDIKVAGTRGAQGDQGEPGDIAGSTGAADNAVLVADGVGGSTLKATDVIIDSSENVTGIATLTLPNTGLHLLDTNASHDLIIAPGSDLSADHTLTLTTGDADRTVTIGGNTTISQDYSTTGNPQFATIELGAASDTTLSRSAAGVIAVEGVPLYSNVPVNSQSAAYTTVLADAQKFILHPTADNNARTFTIDSNANVAYPIGTCITFINQINTVTISITSDTLTWAGSASTGSRTLAAGGMATAIKVTSTLWFISGVGLS
jgi:hypothetical protein